MEKGKTVACNNGRGNFVWPIVCINFVTMIIRGKLCSAGQSVASTTASLSLKILTLYLHK